MEMNHLGEHPDCGPEWACDQYGASDHDYHLCTDCRKRFTVFLTSRSELVAIGLLPLQ